MKKKPTKLKTPETIEDFAQRELGAILRRERERRRLSLLEVGKRAKKSRSAIHFYETGQRPIHFATLINLCAAIRVSPAFIIERWMQADTFNVLDEQRRKEYHLVIDDMIKFGYSRELDNLIAYYRGLIDKAKEYRERERMQREIKKYFRGREE